MRLLVSGATKTIREHLPTPYLGHLLTPDVGNSIDTLLKTGLPICADNAAFVGFSPGKFCSMLGRIAGKSVQWVAAPDTVGDAKSTAQSFYVWQPILKSLGLPVALVLQDGQERVGVPWNMLDAVFIGGSTEFKLGRVAASIVREAKARGKLAHMGRCNTRQRFRCAASIGCDTADGSRFSKWPSEITHALRWLREIDEQPSLAFAA